MANGGAHKICLNRPGQLPTWPLQPYVHRQEPLNCGPVGFRMFLTMFSTKLPGHFAGEAPNTGLS